ncbi:MAG TPA: biotin/lipoyl-containing protein [Dictyobacter sp.]|jgi:acetyl-CoA carboxylase biotin carboxyl carrier protein|nr:biotin/lipoyl-containing protein [Dictyobacter sp.]
MEKHNNTWLDRVEAIVNVLEGSTVNELELTEGDTEIIIRRAPRVVLSAAPVSVNATNVIAPAGRATRAEQGVAVTAPLTGVYYSAASPASPTFANVGDTVHVGQVVALIEAMKVFNEITSEVSGRVVAVIPTNGDVVQKGDALLRIEPL